MTTQPGASPLVSPISAFKSRPQPVHTNHPYRMRVVWQLEATVSLHMGRLIDHILNTSATVFVGVTAVDGTSPQPPTYSPRSYVVNSRDRMYLIAEIICI